MKLITNNRSMYRILIIVLFEKSIKISLKFKRKKTKLIIKSKYNYLCMLLLLGNVIKYLFHSTKSICGLMLSEEKKLFNCLIKIY